MLLSIIYHVWMAGICLPMCLPMSLRSYTMDRAIRIWSKLCPIPLLLSCTNKHHDTELWWDTTLHETQSRRAAVFMQPKRKKKLMFVIGAVN